jgi:5-methylcytosine-specific restriction endonuclease McrA
MKARGLSWCRGCKAWLPSRDVDRRGVCRTHANAEWRGQYPQFRENISARKMARKRGLAIVAPFTREVIFDRFDGRCAYCGRPATTLDHVIPVKHGGESKRGNLLPACASCNPRKRTKSLEDFLEECEARGQRISDQIADELCMEAVL